MSRPGAVAEVGGSRTQAWRVLAVEVADELRGVVREPVTLFFSVAMPVGFFALFASLYGQQPTEGTTAGTLMLATFGTFGVVGVALLTPGVSIAEDRSRGWLRAKAVSPTPVATTLTAKAVATVPHALGVLLAMTAVGVAIGGVRIGVATWLALAGVLLLGALPFVLIGLAVGSVASSNATVAVLQAVFIPSAVASGLWFPLEQLPGWVQGVAPALPTYHLAQLALAQVDGSPALRHLLALVAATLVTGAVAAVAYRNLRP